MAKKLSTNPKAVAARERRAAKREAQIDHVVELARGDAKPPETPALVRDVTAVMTRPEVPEPKAPRVSKKVPHAALAVACPKCSAAAGERCVSAKKPDYPVDIVHKDRAKAHTAPSA